MTVGCDLNQRIKRCLILQDNHRAEFPTFLHEALPLDLDGPFQMTPGNMRLTRPADTPHATIGMECINVERIIAAFFSRDHRTDPDHPRTHVVLLPIGGDASLGQLLAHVGLHGFDHERLFGLPRM